MDDLNLQEEKNAFAVYRPGAEESGRDHYGELQGKWVSKCRSAGGRIRETRLYIFYNSVNMPHMQMDANHQDALPAYIVEAIWAIS